MSTPNPSIGSGQQFKYQASLSPFDYVSVKGVQSITPGSTKNDIIDVTDTDSGRARVFITGLQDNGDVTVVCNYLPGDTSQVAMKGFFDSGEEVAFEIVYAGSLGTEAFSGVVQSADRTYPNDKNLMITYKVKVTSVVEIS
jgi:predicted secreted protein